MRTPWTAGEVRRALVYGLGLSGKAAAQLLRARGVEVVGVDARERGQLALAELANDAGFSVLAGGEAAPLPAVDLVVLSPGVPATKPLLAAAGSRAIPVIAEVELAFPFVRGPIAAITGSNGKSTTTALTGALLAAAGQTVEVCGNIGTPLSARVDGPGGRSFVVELSSFQLETTDTFHPRAAALLNLSPDHLDRYPAMGDYAAAKRRIFLRQWPDDVAVLNADDPQVAATVVAARRRYFSTLAPVEDGCFVDGDTVVEAAPGLPPAPLFARADLPLPGVHNLENAMAAALLARALGAPPAAIVAGLREFRGLPHRMTPVANVDGVSWYDDSKGTNIGAAVRAVEGFADGSVHWILGGRAKGADPRELRDAVRRKARRVYLIGESADSFEAALADVAAVEMSRTLERAVDAAAVAAQAGEAVVLSPACASFDQFRDFNDRGDQFRRLVRARLGLGEGG
jgi:UDP-N-acetylmuramoylalanine--D-glutamate ligase